MLPFEIRSKTFPGEIEAEVETVQESTTRELAERGSLAAVDVELKQVTAGPFLDRDLRRHDQRGLHGAMTTSAVLGAVDRERADFPRRKFEGHRSAAGRDRGVQSQRLRLKSVRAVGRNDVQPDSLTDPDLDALRREGGTRDRDVNGSCRIDCFGYQRDEKGERQEQRRTETFHLSLLPGCASNRCTGVKEDADERLANDCNRSRDERGYRGGT